VTRSACVKLALAGCLRNASHERGCTTSEDWPFLVIAQRYHPEASVQPSALLIPETYRLFVGAGTRLLAYDLAVISGVFEQVVYFFKRFSCSYPIISLVWGLIMALPQSRWPAWFRTKASSEIVHIFYS
jgi:hypothetical protein